MCFMCSKYGVDGQRWFLNSRQYARNLYRRVGAKEVLKAGEEARARPYGGAASAQARIDELKARRADISSQEFDEAVTEDNEKVRQEGAGAQILTLDEAYQVVDLGNPVALVGCTYKKETRAKLEANEDAYSDLGVGVGLLKWERWPETYKGGIHVVTREEAKSRLKEAYARGYCLALQAFDQGYVGGICLFEPSNHGPAYDRLNFGLMGSLIKGHKLVSVDYDVCNGCSVCVESCQFGALTYEVGRKKIWLDLWRCYGCGQCVPVCPVNAFEMIERASLPMLKEAW